MTWPDMSIAPMSYGVLYGLVNQIRPSGPGATSNVPLPIKTNDTAPRVVIRPTPRSMAGWSLKYGYVENQSAPSAPVTIVAGYAPSGKMYDLRKCGRSGGCATGWAMLSRAPATSAKTTIEPPETVTCAFAPPGAKNCVCSARRKTKAGQDFG